MALRIGVLLLLAAIAATVTAQQKVSGFVLDESRPYVYIQFDHTGKRIPLMEGEPGVGIWLKLVNNCRIPISLQIFDGGKGNAGVGVYDEIIPAPGSGFGYVDSSGISHGYSDASGTLPKGYARDEVSSSTVLRSGESLLFSVPQNHVGKSWHLRVEFQMEPVKKGVGPQPYSFVEFTWAMIPAGDRH